MLQNLGQKKELLGEMRQLAEDPANHQMAQALVDIVVEMEFAQLEAVEDLHDAMDVDALDVQKTREERREQLLAVIEAIAPGGQGVEELYFDEVASDHVENPERAKSYAGLSEDEWTDQLAKWADVWRSELEDTDEMSDRDLAGIHVERRFGVALAEFETNVVEFDRSQALETLLANNFEAVEHGIKTATAETQARNQSDSNEEDETA